MRRRRWDLDDMVSTSDIARECGVGRPAVSNWIVRYADFPQPLITVSQGNIKIFSRKAVLAWHTEHRGEPPG